MSILALMASLVSSPLLIDVSDKPPNLNYMPVCKDAGLSQAGLKSCELRARAKLNNGWSQFREGDRNECAANAGITGSGGASYVDLLSCLQMTRDARKLDVQ